VKKWIANELSKYSIKDGMNSGSQIFVNIEDDNPLFPVVEMMNKFSAKLAEKDALSSKLENDYSKIKAEFLNLEIKIPSIINKKLQETKADIQREINIGLQSGGGEKLNRVIEILSAFGINVQNTEKEEEDAFLQVVKFESNKLIPPPSKFQANTSQSKNSEIEISSNNSESPVRNSLNKYDSGERNYLRDMSLNFDRNDESVNFTIKNKPESHGHQVCNIQINELKKYCSQLETENLSLNKRIQDQSSTIDDLENKAVVLKSKGTSQSNEIDLLKT
jgi:hypothetical protein